MQVLHHSIKIQNQTVPSHDYTLEVISGIRAVFDLKTRVCGRRLYTEVSLSQCKQASVRPWPHAPCSLSPLMGEGLLDREECGFRRDV